MKLGKNSLFHIGNTQSENHCTHTEIIWITSLFPQYHINTSTTLWPPSSGWLFCHFRCAHVLDKL